jgi:Protein of unknown function (DUF2608).
MYKKIGVMMCVGAAIAYMAMPRKQHQIYELASYANVTAPSFAGPDTIVFFDVDETILTSPETCQFPLLFRVRLLWNFPQFINFSTWECAHSLLWDNSHMALIEPMVVSFIKQLQAQGCVVLGLTSMASGEYGMIPNLPIWRYEMLRGMGIEFSQKFGDCILDDLPAFRNNYPVLYKGILCANQEPKGDVLQSFLKQFALHPRKIIFFDDAVNNLQSVGDACEGLSIPVTLYHYTGADRIRKQWDGDHVLQYLKNLVKQCA